MLNNAQILPVHERRRITKSRFQIRKEDLPSMDSLNKRLHVVQLFVGTVAR